MTKQVKRSSEQRHKLVVEFRRSGLTVHTFCKLHKIGTSTLLAWRREFPEQSAFVPVRIEPTSISLREEELASRASGARLVGARGFALEFAFGSSCCLDCRYLREAAVRALSSFPDIRIFRGTPDFRKRRQSLAALIQSELREDPFGATLFVFMNRRRDCVRALYWDKTGFAMWEKGLEEAKFPWPKKIDRVGCVTLSAKQAEWLLEGIDIWNLRPHAELEYSRVC